MPQTSQAASGHRVAPPSITDKVFDTEDGHNLLAVYQRVTEVLRIEEKKDSCEYRGKPDPYLYLKKEERELAVSIAAARHEAQAAVAR